MPNKLDLGIAIAGSVLVLIAQIILMKIWLSYGVFDQFNVVFDTDPTFWRAQFASGWSSGGFTHPLLPYFFAIPARIASKLAAFAGLISNEVGFRENLAIYVAPLCTAVKAFCLYFTFRLLKLRVIEAALATSFGVLSFSSVVFGAVPSSYAVTGGALALVTLCMLLSSANASRTQAVGFLVAGLIATGTTISNIIHFGWMGWTKLTTHTNKPLDNLIKAILISAVVLIVSLTISFGLGAIRGGKISVENLSPSTKFFNMYSKSPAGQIENLLRFPEFLARTFIPTIPAHKINVLAARNRDPIKFELTYNKIEFGGVSLLLSLTALVIFGGGTFVSYRQGGTWRYLGLGSAASVLTFGGLYSIFGLNSYLYSQAWQVPAVFLAAAWLNCRVCRSPGFIACAIGILIIMLLGDLYVLQNLNSDLATSQR